MANRRDFMAHASAACAALALPTSRSAYAAKHRTPEYRPLRILVLGGTGFIGPHFVRAAVENGHRVAVFNRGESQADLPHQVERLVGDRNSNLKAIKNRDWDAVLDLATYGPGWVRSLGEALHGRVRHYTFISTISVYDNSGDGGHETNENGRLLEYKSAIDPYSLDKPGDQYGQLKVLCEREAEKQFPGKALILRPCYIAGPGDPIGALTYWGARMREGGEVLAAGDPLCAVNTIDVRDLSKWTINLLEQSETGIFNAVGPTPRLNWGSLLKTLEGIDSKPVKLTWVPESWLSKHKITSKFSSLLFWASGITSQGLLILNEKALDHGLIMRPLATTVTETLAWYSAQPPEHRTDLLLGIDGRNDLQDSIQHEKTLLAAWHHDAGDT
jgi:2'-hydroxyisoflavone reductase